MNVQIKCTNIHFFDNSILCCLCHISTSENLLASGSYDKDIRVWNYQKNECLYTLSGHSLSVRSIVKFDKNRFVSGSSDCSILVWEIGKCEPSKHFEGKTKSIHCFVITDENHLAVGSDCSIEIINLDILDNYKIFTTLADHKKVINCLVLFDINLLVSGSLDHTIRIWNITNSICLNTLSGHRDSISSIIKLNNFQIASTSSDKSIVIWNLSKLGTAMRIYE